MLLRKSLSNTKKFFQKTIQTFKSFLSGGGADNYQKLPKTPPYNPPITTTTAATAVTNNIMYTSYGELDKFYTDFTNQWDNTDKEKPNNSKKRSNKKKKKSLSTTTKPEDEDDDYKKKRIIVHEDDQESCSNTINYKGMMREGKVCLVAQKLKELERMDVSNLDHVLDIEEVLHYYSRLTCPAYLEIVDGFFMNMYSEFFASQPIKVL